MEVAKTYTRPSCFELPTESDRTKGAVKEEKILLLKLQEKSDEMKTRRGKKKSDPILNDDDDDQIQRRFQS